MRPVEWEIILKLLEIINRENGKLHPIELENIALQEGAFNSKKQGLPWLILRDFTIGKHWKI